MAIYYVDGSSGSNSNAGTSEGAAWQTITYACANISSGDTVYVKASVEYNEIITVQQSMTEPTKIIGYTSSITDNGRVTVQGGNSLTYNLTTDTQSNYWWYFKNFIFEGATSRCLYATGGFHLNWTMENIIMRPGTGSATTAAQFGNYSSIASSHFVNCVVDGFSSTGFNAKSGLYFTDCIFKNNGGGGLYSDSYTNLEARGCIFANNTGHGFRPKTGLIENCIFYNNGYSAVTSTNVGIGAIKIVNSLFVNHTSSTYQTLDGSHSLNCAFYNNHTKLSSSSRSEGDIDLTADPFVDAANEDFSLNTDAGGGAVLRANKRTVSNTDFHPFNWLTDGSSGGGSTFHPLAQ